MRRAVIATAGTVVGLFSCSATAQKELSRSTRSTPAPGRGSTNPAHQHHPRPGHQHRHQHGPSTARRYRTAASSSSDRTYTGQDVSYRYGDIEVAVTVDGGRIVTVSVPQDDAFSPYSQTVNSAAVPILVREAVAAQGLNFDVVSGATYTSDAFAQSLQSALDKASQ